MSESKRHLELRLTESEIDFAEEFARQHGLAALFDHLGLDGLGNQVGDLRRRIRELEEQLERQGTNIKALYKQRREAELACELSRGEVQRLEEQYQAALDLIDRAPDMDSLELRDACREFAGAYPACDCVPDVFSSRACPKCGRRAVAYPASTQPDPPVIEQIGETAVDPRVSNPANSLPEYLELEGTLADGLDDEPDPAKEPSS